MSGIVMHLRGPMTDEPTPHGGIPGFPTGLTWYQHHRAARAVASASTDATDCALLLAALGIHPGDGLPISDQVEGLVSPGARVPPTRADEFHGNSRGRAG